MTAAGRQPCRLNRPGDGAPHRRREEPRLHLDESFVSAPICRMLTCMVVRLPLAARRKAAGMSGWYARLENVLRELNTSYPPYVRFGLAPDEDLAAGLWGSAPLVAGLGRDGRPRRATA